MTAGLFPTSDPQHIELRDAAVSYVPRLTLPAPDDVLLERLIAETPWRADSITVFGRRYLQPRLMQWYGDADARYRYSGLALEPLAWTPLLAELRALCEQAASATFNSVLVNYYRDGRDSMGMHADDEPELGPAPTIASMSLGAERVFVMKHRHDRTLATVRLPLASGSLLIMRGATQRHWKHGIPKTARPCGPRVNLTFRRVESGSPAK